MEERYQDNLQEQATQAIGDTPCDTPKKEGKRWTEEQLQAIDCRDRTLLVSASAGAGKSSVLTERVIQSLLDTSSPTNLSRILVVTFTEAAAAELKEKIRDALSKAIQNNTGDPHLREQLKLLPTAQISTIHAFCLSLLRKHHAQAGIPQNVRVADETETAPLTLSILEELLEDAYQGVLESVPTENLRRLIEDLHCLQDKKTFIKLIHTLYQKAATTKEGASVLFRHAEKLKCEASMPMMETHWGHLLKEQILANLRKHSAILLSCWETEIKEEPISLEKTADAYAAWQSVISEIESRIDDYNSLHSFLSLLQKPTFPKNNKNPKPGDYFHSEATLHFKDCMDTFWAYIKDSLRAHCLCYSEEEWHTVFEITATRVHTLATLVSEYDTRYRQKMRERGAIDYNQMERFAFDLLYRGGEVTPLGKTISKNYDAVYIDEYQDVSPLQHAIFEVVGSPRNRFMVGDIKQSIYRFRLADPDIFSYLKKTFPALDLSDKKQEHASVFMTNNFRCDKSVVDFSNRIFSYLFTYTGDSIAYSEKDDLVYGKKEDGLVYTFPVQTVFFDQKDKTATDVLASDDSAPQGESVKDEALWVAKEIHDLLEQGTMRDGTTKICPDDIVILLRSVKDEIVSPYMEALADWGIPCVCEEKKDFFLIPEVQLALSLLYTIDNPRRDIELSGALLSPLYGFTPDELVLIRKEAPKEACLFEALYSYVERHPSFEKGSFFLRQLAAFREKAEGVPVYRLLAEIYRETPIMAVAGWERKGAENNLKLLYNYARTCQGVSEDGLYSFLRFVRAQLEANRSFKPPKKSGGGAVRILTMHASKGLQFPVVFVSNLGKEFNPTDYMGDLLYDEKQGFAMKLMHPQGDIRYKPPTWYLLSEHLRKLQVEEEIRLLYVALTRAQERLYLTGTTPGVNTKKSSPFAYLLDKIKDKVNHPSKEEILSADSMLQLVWMALIGTGECIFPTVCEERGTPPPSHADSLPEAVSVEEIVNTLKSKFSYVYPHSHLTKLPKKLSVSRLTPALLDTEEETTTAQNSDFTLFSDNNSLPFSEDSSVLSDAEDGIDAPALSYRLPLCMQGVTEPKANEMGTATHMFLQFCSFERLKEQGVEREISNLLRLGFLDENTVKLIRQKELELFRNSSLIEMLLAAKEVKRELRFHIRFPARKFTKDPLLQEKLGEETLYVQGVIDAVIVHQDGSITLVDYKTDRLTREERGDPKLALSKLKARHGDQLAYYTEAVTRMFGTPPKEVLLYSLHLGAHLSLSENT